MTTNVLQTTLKFLLVLFLSMPIGIVIADEDDEDDDDDDGPQLIQCPAGQILRSDGTGFVCSDDTDTNTDALGDLSLLCSPGQVPKLASPGVWVCGNDLDTDTDTLGGLGCGNGQIAKFNGSTWACGNDNTTTGSGSCATGYTRVAPWCLDTTGLLFAARVTTARDVAVVPINLNTVLSVAAGTVKAVLLQTQADVTHTSAFTGADAGATSCALPGDSPINTCGLNTPAAVARTVLAGEDDLEIAVVLVRTDASGNIKTFCQQFGQTSPDQLSSIRCNWWILGYLD